MNKSFRTTIQTVLCFSLSLLLMQTLFAEEKEPKPCLENPKYQEFDFWVGSWEVLSSQGFPQGTNVIEKKFDNCVITENWTSITGSKGFSTNYFNPVTGSWAQRWVSANTIIEYDGGLKNGSMVLEGTIYYHKTKLSSPFRGTWTLLEDGRVRQFFEQYNEKDSKWDTWFEGFYVKIEDKEIKK